MAVLLAFQPVVPRRADRFKGCSEAGASLSSGMATRPDQVLLVFGVVTYSTGDLPSTPEASIRPGSRAAARFKRGGRLPVDLGQIGPRQGR